MLGIVLFYNSVVSQSPDVGQSQWQRDKYMIGTWAFHFPPNFALKKKSSQHAQTVDLSSYRSFFFTFLSA